jgi:pimeloyl-ACP methyl ester carboxylesterase
MTTRRALLCASLSLWLPTTTSTAVLPVVGEARFDVAIASTLLTDSDRRDPFAADGRARSIMVSSFNPVKNCHQKGFATYMPSATANFQDEKYGAYGLPNGSFRSLSFETCKNGTTKRTPCSAESIPLVLFSGALATSRLLYTGMLQNIAAAGYMVVSIDHPYDSDIVEFPNGTMITAVDINSDTELGLALSTRADDFAFMRQQMVNATVMDQLFPGQMHGRHARRTAVIGHSFGGAAAAAAMVQDHTISAGLNIDGSMFGDVLTKGLDRPFVLIGHEDKTQETDPSWKAVWPQLTGWKKEFEVQGAAHYSFSDLPLITSVLGIQDKLPKEVGQVLGTVEGRRMTTIIATYTTAFLDMVFKSSGEGLMSNSNTDFPEVRVVA